MGFEQIMFLTLGIIILVYGGITGLGLKTRKGQRAVKLMGEIPARIFYSAIGILFIVIAFVLY